MKKLTMMLKLLRVRHYVKNALVFLPIIYSGNLFKYNLLIKVLIGFVCFCLVSSSIYIINDINDVERDKLHPTKKNRPIASGAVTKRNAFVVAIVCFLLSCSICIFVCGIYGLLCVIAYFAINILYSRKLKNIPIIDVVVLVSGFFVRVLFGSVITYISISTWLFLTIISISFYLGLGKRRNEIKLANSLGENNITRTVLSHYNYAFLDKNMYMCMALANVFYALWAADHTIEGMLWTVPFAIIISMKYSLIVEGDSDGDPVEVILHDKVLIALFALYIVTVFLMMYVVK